MPEKVMHPRITALATEFLVLTENAPSEPTQWDRDRLLAVRSKIKNLGNEDGIKLSEGDENDRQFLYVQATIAANRQEEFYESNGNKWVKRPYAKMSDEEAQAAINTCIRRRLRGGTVVADIHTALKDDVGVTDVELSIYPAPVDGRLPNVNKREFQYQFTARGPSGAVIH